MSAFHVTLLLSLLGAAPEPARLAPQLFVLGEECMACHNSLTSVAGQDVSIGTDWRPSMMANSARDPYWQGSVRRETIEHAGASAAIQAECAICHMPMAHVPMAAAGRPAEVFANLDGTSPLSLYAQDGVACAVCHQVENTRLGDAESFSGRFTVDTQRPLDQRRIFGPYEVGAGAMRVMRSATGFPPRKGGHIQKAELCASCHTLFTHALVPGAPHAAFPEQTPYLEWRQSAFAEERPCQGCHLKVVQEEVPIASVAGMPRAHLSQHEFRGGNFFMLRVMAQNRAELGLKALPQELEATSQRTIDNLRYDSAELEVACGPAQGKAASVDVTVRNLAGHKLPTAYPSRRVWLNLTVRDGAGGVVFESGALRPDGSIAGNDNDADAARFEPHHTEIHSADQVQIYEPILGGPDGKVTTGLLTATQYLKDNRLLPVGFDKAKAPGEVAVHGAAREDADFTAGQDRVRYALPSSPDGTYRVEARLWYQPIGFRWATNLQGFDAPEPQRFTRYFTATASGSATLMQKATTRCGERAVSR